MPIPYFDAHCDTVSRIVRHPGVHLTENTDHWDLNKLNQDAPRAQIFAMYHDCRQLDFSNALQDQMQAFQAECARYSERVAHCRNAQQAQQAFAEGKLAAFLSVEGAELLDCSVERLRWAHKMGVRGVNVTWNNANALSGSHKDEPQRGLSQQGIAFVSAMNELGMLIDVSHLSEPGFWDVMNVTAGPIIASHSNAQSVFFHTRNLTDAQITAIINKRGIIGLNCHSTFLGEGVVTMATLQRHLDHMLALGGEQTVALGGDWDGGILPPVDMEGCWSWYAFYEYLAKQNYPEALLQDLFFNNLMRTVREVCTI